VDDAPETYIDAQLKGIVGIEIEIGEIEGKWKVSQNRPENDRTGVADGLEAEGIRRKRGQWRSWCGVEVGRINVTSDRKAWVKKYVRFAPILLKKSQIGARRKVGHFTI
jgi:hypothetical protein